MSDVNHLFTDVNKLLLDEGRLFSKRVKSNLSSKKITKSGKTEKSIKEEVSNQILIVWGRHDFHNLEKGVSPNEAQRLNFQQLKNNIYEWSKYLPLTFADNKKRYSFAWNVSNKIVQVGTKLYRDGGRKDIYSNEFQPLYDAITDKIGKIIIEHKLI